MFIFGKIKTYIIATLTLAIPLIYLMGRIKGRAAEKNKVLEDDLQAQKKATNFYKAVSKHEDAPISSRANLLSRLRKDGL